MDEVLKHLSNICAMDRATLGVIFALCAVAAFTIKDYLANPFTALLVLPLLFAFSVITKYLFILGEMYPFNKLDQWLMWTILAGSTGVVVGIGCVTALAALRERLGPKREAPKLSRAIR